MLGDNEKMFSKGDKFTLNINGNLCEAEVKDVDITGYDRRYLVMFLANSQKAWTTNRELRRYLYPN